MGETREPSGWHFWHWLGPVLAAYLIPFVALLLDEMLFNGRFYQSLGAEAQIIVCIIHFSLIATVNFFGWFD
jgi:hypothetical protein